MKNRIVALMLITTVAIATITAGCSKKNNTPTKGDVTSVEETSPSEEETSPSEAPTTSSEVETEIETKEDGSVTVNTTTYETDAEGEVVTDAEGEKVIAETKTETFTKEEWESKTAATKPVETKPAETKAPTEATTAAPQATKAPTEPQTEAQTKAPVVKPTEAPVTPTQAPTQAPTVAPTQAPTVAPTQAPTIAPTAAPTEAPKQTEAPTANPKAGWTKATHVIDDETLTLYSNGEWIFDLIEETSNPGEFFGPEWYLGQGVTSGIAIYKYIGNNEVVNIPGYINGFPVKILIFPFYENPTVKEVTVAKEIEYFFQAFNHASVAKATIETGSKAIGADSWGAADNFNTKRGCEISVYCDKAVAEAIKGWNLEPVICYSFDGNAVYYNSHTDRTSH